jgi:hypothetical protein
MGQFVTLEINKDIATQQAVVEYQIHIKMIIIEGEAFLSCFKQKAFSQFQQEVFQLVNDSGFQSVAELADAASTEGSGKES